MTEPPALTDEVFTAFLKCRYKAYLKLHGTVGEKSEYEQVQARLAAKYRAAAQQELLKGHAGATVIESTPSLADAIQLGAALVADTAVSDGDKSCRIDALERDGRTRPPGYRPVLFVRHEKVTPEDRLLLAFAASVLGRVLGTPPDTGRIVHGREFKSSRVVLASLSKSCREKADRLRTLAASNQPPPLLLNKHCPECEFRVRCRAAAAEKDDLSLLRGLSPQEIEGLNRRGIFTVTQYSYSFRPGRMKRATAGEAKRHDHSLQALAVREKTVYVARRPDLPSGRSRLFLDVEGLPDDDFYYLIGLTIVEGESRRHLAFWADGPSEEATAWASFLAAVRDIEDFVLFHYGSYESKFLEAMEARYGGDSGLLVRIRARRVNVLSLIYAHIYFPTYSNDLKSVAGCLGFRWSSPDASGLKAVAWRHQWEASRDPSLKQLLLIYNQEDCLAVERVERLLQCVGDGTPPPGNAIPPVAGVEEVPRPHRHQFGATKFALPEFARITRCAYFDYQRDKVLCRTTPRLRQATRRKKAKKRLAWKVNREVEWGRPSACPHCGSTGMGTKFRQRKLVIDLKPVAGGIRRQVTRHIAWRYRCHNCCGTFLPAGYLAMSSGYGQGVLAWVVYSSISLRQSNEGIGDALEEWFGLRFGRSYASRVRRQAVEYYQATYDSLLTALRNGSVAHADETKVKMKGAIGSGYVWVFASPDTALYVYSPTRDATTLRQTLSGFKGVLVSDFYSAYDSLGCPQQKCLIHLIRDFNDDLLKHPFDEELKQQTARFTAVLQAVVETVDRYGLKSYHLHKHHKDVDLLYAAESRSVYKSELARHYQHRLQKNRDKLFTFLDHDGVPWNNNNAENAVKAFVSRRKVMGMPFTEAGIRDYLLLLSICQTLRYRDTSFWRFLVSGETDIEAFTARRRGRG